MKENLDLSWDRILLADLRSRVIFARYHYLNEKIKPIFARD